MPMSEYKIRMVTGKKLENHKNEGENQSIKKTNQTKPNQTKQKMRI
jgi:hypothetical protein